MEEYGIWSLLPPLVAIGMAMLTKRTILSLIVGAWVGLTIIYKNPITAIPLMVKDMFIPRIADEWNAQMILLCMACGGFVYMIKCSGAAKGFGDFISKRVKKRKSGMLIAYASAFAFIFTEPTLTLGAIMRPVTERLRVSRVKLAYICDVLGCPFASLSPITSYSAYATGLIGAELIALSMTDNPWGTFIQSIPFNLYCIFGMLTLLYVIVRSIDVGPMYAAEKRAVETGHLVGENDDPTSKEPANEFENVDAAGPLPVYNFFIPLAVLFISLFSVILWSGNVSENGIGGAFREGNIPLAITTGFFIAGAVAGILGARSKLYKPGEIVGKFITGIMYNIEIPIILVLAWTIGNITTVMDLKGYLIAIVANASLPVGFLPAFIFLVGAFVAFATGSSWGVWAIMMPIAIPMADAFGLSIPLMIGAAISGGAFGDHCSPISDTTVLASTASGADHIQHVRTQLPYAITVAIASVIGFLFGGFVAPVAAVIATAVVIVLAMQVLRMISKKKYGTVETISASDA
jgi:Na+/H+ antiporter NhaC